MREARRGVNSKVIPGWSASRLLTGRTRETKIRRDARGRWFNDGSPITHTLLTRAFDEWLIPAPDGSGRWALSNSINWAFVAIEGPPRFVRSVRLEGGRALLTLSDGSALPLDPSTLREATDGALFCEVQHPDHGPLEARFDAHAAMQLASALGEDARGIYVELGGVRHYPAME